MTKMWVESESSHFVSIRICIAKVWVESESELESKVLVELELLHYTWNQHWNKKLVGIGILIGDV